MLFLSVCSKICTNMLELIKNWALKVHPYSMTVVWTYTGFEEGLLQMLYFLHVGDIMMIDCCYSISTAEARGSAARDHLF